MSKEHDELSRSRTFGARADIARTGREALVQTFLTAWGDHQDLRQRGAPIGELWTSRGRLDSLRLDVRRELRHNGHPSLPAPVAPFGRGETAEPVTRTGTGIGTGRPLYRP
jgi:hypothetical protein